MWGILRLSIPKSSTRFRPHHQDKMRLYHGRSLYPQPSMKHYQILTIILPRAVLLGTFRQVTYTKRKVRAHHHCSVVLSMAHGESQVADIILADSVLHRSVRQIDGENIKSPATNSALTTQTRCVLHSSNMHDPHESPRHRPHSASALRGTKGKVLECCITSSYTVLLAN